MKEHKQISFRAEDDLAEQLETWAGQEEISVADFARKLVRISAQMYEEAGSLHELRKRLNHRVESSPKR